MVTPNTFLITLSINFFTIFSSKIKPVINKRKLIYVSLQFFRTAKKCTIDKNVNFHISFTPNYFLCKKKLIPQSHISFLLSTVSLKSLVSCVSQLCINKSWLEWWLIELLQKDFWEIVPYISCNRSSIFRNISSFHFKYNKYVNARHFVLLFYFLLLSVY